VTNGDERIWPVAKVFKRVTNGGEDNVAVYFKVLVEEYWACSNCDCTARLEGVLARRGARFTRGE